MTDTAHAPMWTALLETWDQQQGGYLRFRERRFDAVLEALELLDPQMRVLDVGCGPGSLARRILDRYPDSDVVALDMDPVLLAVGQGALGDAGGRLRWVDSDLREPDWGRALDGSHFDAVVSSTALHWLGPAQLTALYRTIGQIVRPGGLFLNADNMPYDAELVEHTGLADAAVRRRGETAFTVNGRPDWDRWWGSASEVAELAGARAERERRQAQRQETDEDHIPLTQLTSLRMHTAALREAGFGHVATIWQDFDDRVLLAVK